MSPLEFLSFIWPAQVSEGKPHFYLIGHPIKGLRSSGFEHHVFETIEAAAAYCEKMKEQRDIFYCTHTLTEKKVWNIKHHRAINPATNTKDWVAGWSERQATNMHTSREVFFDLDVGVSDPKKAPKYATQREALADLKQFCETVQLPLPVVVSSGGGIHAHWAFNEALDEDAWTPIAAHLRQVATLYKLKFDPSRTLDRSSVLRVPGTFNLKAAPRPVICAGTAAPISASNFHSRLTGALTAKNEVPTVPRQKAKAAPDGLGSNLDGPLTDLPPYTIGNLVRACPQMQRLCAARGDMSEPEWHAGLNLMAYTDKPEENAARFSGKGHYADYDEVATLDKMARAKSGGMIGCDTLRDKCGPANEHVCMGCPFFVSAGGKLRAAMKLNQPKADPIVVVTEVAGETVRYEIDDPPKPYRRVKNAKGENLPGVEMVMTDDKGREYPVLVYPYDLYPIKCTTNIHTQTAYTVWRHHPPLGPPVEFTLDNPVLFGDPRALAQALSNRFVIPNNFDAVREYMSAYIRDLLRREQPTETSNHVGWDTKCVNIILPDRVLRPDGTSGPVSLGNMALELKPRICTGGSEAEQLKLLHFYNDPGYLANQFMVMAAFGSPLLFATTHHGVIINAFSNGPGASKSTTAYTAAGIYGPPERYAMTGVKEAGATDLSRANRAFALHSLPFVFDELSLLLDEEVRALAMAISQGTLKIRLKRDGTPQPNPFGEDVVRHSLMISTGNKSLYNTLANFPIAGAAATMRVFEILFTRGTIHTRQQGQEFEWRMKEHYGWIGPRYLAQLVQMKVQAAARVQRMVNELGDELAAGQEERYLLSGSAAVLVGGEISYAMKLSPYAVKPVREWLVNEQFPYIRSVVKDTLLALDPLTILTDYLEQFNGKILKVFSPAQHFPGYTTTNGELVGHFDTVKGWMYINKAAFKEHCRRRGMDSQDILRRLFHDHVVTSIDQTFKIGNGIREYEKAPSRCFRVNMLHPAIAGVGPKLTVVPASAPAALAAVPAAAP